MMNIMVLCVGKLKEKYWTDAVCEYAKRLSPYCTLKIDEVKEARLPDNAGPAEEEAVKEAEGREILRRIDRDAYVISLEIKGKELSSEQLAAHVQELGVSGRSNVVFIIGGSLGLSPAGIGARRYEAFVFADDIPASDDARHPARADLPRL